MPYFAALVIVALCALLGTAACRACVAPLSLAPVTGLALLLALTTLTVQLPGRATTAAVATALATGVAAAYLVRVRVRVPRAAALGALLAGLGAAAVTTLPFLSAGHLGIPGQSLNNDTAVHVLWADGLRSASMARLYPSNPGYPLGPHSLVAAIAQGCGMSTADVLVGLLVATVVLLAFTAFGVLRCVPLALRVPSATFCAVSYLTAAWFAQGAFKEPMMALLLLGFGLAVAAALAQGTRLLARSLVPAALIAAASLLTYSYLAAAWFGVAVLLAVALAALDRRPAPAAVLAGVRSATVPLVVGLAVAVAATAAEIPRILRYLGAVGASPAEGAGGIGVTNLGNLAAPLRRSEALPIWPSGDFRFPPPESAFLYHELKALAIIALVGGGPFLLARRRDVGLMAAAGAGVVVWALSDRGQSPYVTAKSLAILSPLIALVILRALLPMRLPATRPWRAVWALRIVVAAAIVVAGFWSTELVLRSSPVESTAQRDQLAQLRPLVQRGPTLFLGDDDYAPVRLAGIPLGYVGVGFPSPIAVPTRPQKPFTYGNAVDWDSVSAATLDRFRYVVAVRSPYASAAPANFRPLRATPLFEAWERVGPTVPRATIESDGLPVGRLECARSPSARALARRRGMAAVERRDSAMLSGALPALGVGDSASLAVRLPRGRWQLAMKYTSSIPLRLQFDGARLPEVPANTTRPGSWWPVGAWTSDGRPHTLWTIGERVSRLSATAFPASISGIVAVPAGGEQLVPLRRACGRLVDWYRLG